MTTKPKPKENTITLKRRDSTGYRLPDWAFEWRSAYQFYQFRTATNEYYIDFDRDGIPRLSKNGHRIYPSQIHTHCAHFPPNAQGKCGVHYFPGRGPEGDGDAKKE